MNPTTFDPTRDDTLREAIESTVDGWYPPGTRIDWDDFLDRVETLSDIDLGSDTLSPRVVAIKKYAKELRKP